MGHGVPFQPAGTCQNCAFSRQIDKNHWQTRYHTLVCKRFPPNAATSVPGDGPWSHEVFVHDNNYCGEWKKEGEAS